MERDHRAILFLHINSYMDIITLLLLIPQTTKLEKMKMVESGSSKVKSHGDGEWTIYGPLRHHGQPAIYPDRGCLRGHLSGPLRVTERKPTQRILIQRWSYKDGRFLNVEPYHVIFVET